jgi:UDP-N-acetyl-2-amino-2-deoxyglucuronate dehydrogenase
MLYRNEPIVDRKIKLALVGCGRISKNHFEAVRRHEADVELVAVCDIDAQALETAAKATGAKAYTHYARLLAESDADAVVVSTPSGLHPEHVMQAAASGRHVVCEKPMGTRWRDALAMVKACDEHAVRLFIVKQNRRNPTLQLLKKAVVEKRFGRIYLATVNVFWARPQEYYDSASWRGTWEFDGGALMNQASHYVDLLDWLLGPVESVQAYTATLARNIQVEDTGVACLRWRSGALGSINVTMLTHPKNYEGSITIIGEKGTARIGGVAVNKVEYWEFAEPREEDGTIDRINYDTASVYGFGHPLYYKNVIDVLRGKDKPETDGREGLKSMELLIAFYLSARDGRRIALPLEY